LLEKRKRKKWEDTANIIGGNRLGRPTGHWREERSRAASHHRKRKKMEKCNVHAGPNDGITFAEYEKKGGQREKEEKPFPPSRGKRRERTGFSS